MNKKIVARYLVLEILLILAWLDGAMDLLATAGMILAYGVMAILIVILTIKAAWRRQGGVFFHALMITVVATSTAFIAAKSLSAMRKSTLQHAGHLIRNIDDYQRQQGAYPPALDATHGFATSDNVTAYGLFIEHTYRYKVVDGGYTLSFSEPGFVVSTFESTTRQWKRSD